ncbi:MAG: SET domain-containing protein [Chitinophagaceae bacterium]|nr:SET domain-containing protein [Chitinophagaceae bacterium]MCB0740671.1 SET domain-containing protein [Chitinophagaceae bacterium]HQV06055.1 SET domain-containing protein [Chitinophagaceae bacterium]
MPKQNIQQKQYNIIYPVTIAKSNIAGKGAYALRNIPRRKKIGDLGGTIISMQEAQKLIRRKKIINLVELDDDKALNAAENPNDLRFINHSCNPNTFMRVLKNRVEFYALKNIRKGEELSCHYGETHHEGQLPCRCGAKNCQGYI